jgi:hypothetical protein
VKSSYYFQNFRADKSALQNQYDRTITEVNQRLSDKANLQINLNETRDTVRETNQYVSDIEISYPDFSDTRIDYRHRIWKKISWY